MTAAASAVGRRIRRFCCGSILIAGLLLFAGCSAELIFVGDPALRATLFAVDEFESGIRRAGRAVSMRTDVFWPAESTLDAIRLEPAIAGHSARVVVLSPYLSLFAGEVASRFPDRHFIGFYGQQGLPNLTWVHFNRRAAMSEAGRALARWVFEGEGRDAVILVDESDRSIRDEALDLAAGYEEIAGIAVRQVAFTAPSRDEVRSRVEALSRGTQRAVIVLLGASTTWALETLRDEALLVGYRFAAVEEDPARVLFTVRDDLATGIRSAIGAPGGRVVVDSLLQLSPVHFPVSDAR